MHGDLCKCRRTKIFYLSHPGIEPMSLELQANTLPRRCKNRLLPQGSRSVLYTKILWHTPPPIRNSSLNFLEQESREMRPREIFMHRTVIGWVSYGGRHCRRVKIFYLSHPRIEPRSLDLQANTLPRRCKSRLLPQGSRSVLYTKTLWHKHLVIDSSTDRIPIIRNGTRIYSYHHVNAEYLKWSDSEVPLANSMLFYIVLTPISTTSGLWSTGNTCRYQQISVYIYQCVYLPSEWEIYDSVWPCSLTNPIDIYIVLLNWVWNVHKVSKGTKVRNRYNQVPNLT